MALRVLLWVPGPGERGGCAFASAFRAAGGELAGVLVGRQPTTFSRFRALARRIWRSPSAELRRMLGRVAVSAAYRFGKTTLEALVECRSPLESWALAFPEGDLRRHCRDHAIPYLANVALDAKLRHSVGREPAGVACFGMGLVPAEVLCDDSLLLFNAHMGSVPRYRGMHAIEWALLEGESPGVSVMTMSPGIDMGDVVQRASTDLTAARSLEEVRRRSYALSIDAMVRAALAFQSGRLVRQAQDAEGRTCYRMHPRLRQAVADRLAGELGAR